MNLMFGYVTDIMKKVETFLNIYSINCLQFYLIVNGKRIKKKRTAAVKFNDPSNPIWNESFTFNFPQATIPASAFEVSLSDEIDLNY